MSLKEAFNKGIGKIVIIDDLYLPPNPDAVTGAVLGDFLRALKAFPENCEALADLLGLPRDTNANKLVDSVNENLQKVYAGYQTKNHSYLEPLFIDLDHNRTAGLGRLRMLERAIEEFFHVKPTLFTGVEEARESLSECTMVFVDFFLSGVTNYEEARRHHSAVRKELAAKFSLDENSFPKVIVLMSTALPGASDLATFRQDTQIRAAFFHAIDKKTFSEESLRSNFERFLSEYDPAEKLNKYLETMEAEVRSAAEKLAQELRSGLDVHDLTILKTLRLDGESDTPQAYLTLLLSEALAARVRMATGLQTEVLPKQQTYGDSPFDGKLLPSSVLFHLFADIAVSPTPADGELKVAFGDVFESIDGDTKGTLYLAISPACDLQRCEPTYEVLCVTGRTVDSSLTLSKLIGTKYTFGQGKLVLKTTNDKAETSYIRLTFETKSLRTIPVSHFKDRARYRRLARLTEVFAQEIKTLALNNVARVGVPIDPSFSVGLKAKVRFNLKGDKQGDLGVQGEHDVDDSMYLPAVLSMGRELGEKELQPTVMFSSQFCRCIQDIIAGAAVELIEKGQTCKQLEAVREHFAGPGSSKISLNNNNYSKNIGNNISIKYYPQLPKLPDAKNFEITLYSELEEDK